MLYNVDLVGEDRCDIGLDILAKRGVIDHDVVEGFVEHIAQDRGSAVDLADDFQRGL